VVIGGGPARVTAALRARELRAEVILIEREKLGGTCTNDGCVPTRALAKDDIEKYRCKLAQLYLYLTTQFGRFSSIVAREVARRRAAEYE
jgi:pyruvate/2-oxoglutarate dehydrogenase complex dihydrolipoamide dehydrogenase (E3) component